MREDSVNRMHMTLHWAVGSDATLLSNYEDGIETSEARHKLFCSSVVLDTESCGEQ